MKTTNLQISKKLKEIGFEAENDFYWVKWNEGLPELVHKSEIMPALIEKVPAYDLETLIDALPKDIPAKQKYYSQFLFIQLADGPIKIGYYEPCNEYRGHYDMEESIFESFREENESLADTAGRMLIKLHEAGIINFKK